MGDEVREKFRNLQVARGGGRREEMYICRLPGRRSTPHMRMDWGYTVQYCTLFKQRAENPPEYEKP